MCFGRYRLSVCVRVWVGEVGWGGGGSLLIVYTYMYVTLQRLYKL
jgi:hypothetical protein